MAVLRPAAGTTVDRLGLDVSWSRTGGSADAAEALASTLAAGDPAIVWPGRYHLKCWNLPPFLDGWAAIRSSPTPPSAVGCTSTTARWRR